MDSGFLKPGETLEDDYDVLRPLEPAEVLGIIDGLLSSEVGGIQSRRRALAYAIQVAWHMGHPLSRRCSPVYISTNSCGRSQNVAKMLALLATPDVDSRGNPYLHLVLRAYCMGLIKTCDCVHGRINTETYYEVRRAIKRVC